jgi:hypothetical protein
VRLKENYVGTHFKDYDTYLILSHFKGHAMGGFGGAIKNLSIGFASGMSVAKSGKLNIHSAGRSVTSWTHCPQDEFLESMAEADLDAAAATLRNSRKALTSRAAGTLHAEAART